MIRQLALVAATVALTACAGLEPAGRNANRPHDLGPAPTMPAARAAEPLPPPQPQQRQATAPPAATPAPAPPQAVAAAPQAAPPEVATPNVAAPNVAAPPPPPRRVASNDGDIVVPGTIDRQVPPPNGDPRSVTERMEDIRAWDRCVMRVQGVGESDPTRPQLETPEDVCRQSLGMASRTAVPDSRLQRRR